MPREFKKRDLLTAEYVCVTKVTHYVIKTTHWSQQSMLFQCLLAMLSSFPWMGVKTVIEQWTVSLFAILFQCSIFIASAIHLCSNTCSAQITSLAQLSWKLTRCHILPQDYYCIGRLETSDRVMCLLSFTRCSVADLLMDFCSFLTSLCKSSKHVQGRLRALRILYTSVPSI